MAVTHAFVSAKSDGGDATVVRPSNWNADHLATSFETVNSTTATSLRVYNTYTDASNYERGVFDWTTTANTLMIGTQNAGTGTARNLWIVTPSTGYIEFRADGGSSAGTIRFSSSGFVPLATNSIDLGYPSGGYSWKTFTVNGRIAWDTSGTVDTGLARNAAGVVEVNNGTPGTLRDIKARDITLAISASVTPANNGELVIQATSNTSLTFKYKGSDGTVRSASLTLT